MDFWLIYLLVDLNYLSNKKAGFYQKRLGFPDDPWVEVI